MERRDDLTLEVLGWMNMCWAGDMMEEEQGEERELEPGSVKAIKMEMKEAEGKDEGS